MGPEGLELLELAKKETGLPIVSEVMDISQLQYFDNVGPSFSASSRA